MSRRRNQPLLIAHRGDPAHAPENTLASFRSALSRGARAVEMDVRRCPDGTWIVFHDRFSRRPLRAAGSQEPVPTVTQALSFCRSRSAAVFLDVKEPRHEKELLALVARSGWLPKTTVFASTLSSLRRWRRLLPPGHPLFWVTGYRAPLTPRRVALARAVPVTGIAAYKGQITQASIKEIHNCGMRVMVWTTRTAGEIHWFARMGVDGMMSEVW